MTCAVGMKDIGRVALGGKREFAARGFNPRLKTIHQDHTPRRWSGGGKEQGVITTRPDAAGRARSKTAAAISFEPFVL